MGDQVNAGATGKGHGDKRERLRDQAIAALLSHPTVEAAATATGVSKTTLLRWMQDPEFQRAYRDVRRQVMDRSIGRLQAATGEAVTALRAAARSRGSVRVSAARAIWEFSFRARELMDIEERLAALEARVGDHGGGR